jgi:hypothetical protein
MRDAPNQIQGNDWVRHGFAPMMTTHIVRSCMRNGESRETYPHETTSLNHNLRRIRCYIPYSEPVWPERRNPVRIRFLNGYTIRNVLLSGLWMWRLFNFDWPVRLPPWAYEREVTPLQEVATETTTTTYEIASWFQSFTPPKSTLSRPEMLWNNSPNPWNYFPAHESFVRSLHSCKEFIFEIWSSCSAPFNNYEDGC